MNLPEQPAAPREPTPVEASWSWRLEDSVGEALDTSGALSAYAAERFENQGDAESWVGQVFGELGEAGVDAVTLFDGGRRVYGPMSLHP